MKFYNNREGNSFVPNTELFERISKGIAAMPEIQAYYAQLKEYIASQPNPSEDFFEALDHYTRIETLLDSLSSSVTNYTLFDASYSSDKGRSAPNDVREKTGSTSDRLEKTSRLKSVHELEAEILAAATSKNPKLALTKVAADNGMYFDVLEAQAKALLQIKGLDNQFDLDKTEYTKLVESVRDLELNISDPGEKEFKLLKIAKQHKLALPQLQQIYFKSLIVQHLSDPIDDKELEKLYPGGQKWVMRGWIPEEAIILFHAHGGTGKTLFVQHLIKHIATGTDWGEYKVEKPGDVLYLQTDTAPKQLKEWLKQSDMLGRDLPIRYHLDWRVECIAQLYQWIKQQRPALVVIDSLASVNKDNTVEENHVNFAKPLLQMRDIAKELGTSFFLIHHSNAGNQVRGTKALRNAADAVWRLESVDPKSPENPKRILTMEKFRARMPLSYPLELNDNDFSWNLLEPEPEEGKPTPNSGARFLIVDYLTKHKGQPFCAQSLAVELVGISESTIRRELPGLYREGLIDREVNPNFRDGRGGKQPRHYYMINM